MEERNDSCDKVDEVMLPGFRFHPTDEELVGFYLKRKIQHKPLSIELIKQLDIYKYDPWDLPKLATTGEKEWYFYCPRDRKYRNSTRPNRVTGAGFWKATGTDRPIYSSEGSKCIGLKKSLVFYKGRAAKGLKTDWMMHEFRLPSLSDSLSPNKRYLDKNIPANEAWAICRIFKKANSSIQRALSHSWVSPLFDTTTTSATTTTSDILNPHDVNNIHFTSSGNKLTTPNKTNIPLQFGFCNDIELSSFSPLHFPPYRPCHVSISNETSKSAATNIDTSTLLLDTSASVFGDLGKCSENVDFNTLHDGFSTENIGHGPVVLKDMNIRQLDDEWRPMGLIPNNGFPLMSLPNHDDDAWKLWDSSPCPSELSTTYSTNKCYT